MPIITDFTRDKRQFSANFDEKDTAILENIVRESQKKGRDCNRSALLRHIVDYYLRAHNLKRDEKYQVLLPPISNSISF